MLPHQPTLLSLDGDYNIANDSWIVIIKPGRDEPVITQPSTVAHGSLAAYGLSGKTTQIGLPDESKWIGENEPFSTIRGTVVYAQSEELTLAEEPISDPVRGGTDEVIELDGLYEDLQSGSWVVVSGEREIEGTKGVRFSELAMLSSVSHIVSAGEREPLPGDRMHTFISLAKPLAYQFKRDTVKIHGNVVKATHGSHGEIPLEVLGSGDASQVFQQFPLKRAPLTFVPAPNSSGVASSLKVYVNDVQWHEADTLVGLQPQDCRFITRMDDGKTSVVFGNGKEGARPPTGLENVRADYRSGIGKSGNVRSEQISVLSSRPLGVKDVINPLAASGGADHETRDQVRKNAPLAVMALDRLVSVQDYEDFARTFAGIAKARAVELPYRRQQVVHLTIAGVDDIPIEPESDLYRNFQIALRKLGDPCQPILISIRELMLLVISANVRIDSDYLWEKVERQIRNALLDAFSFECRDLGQDALLSEMISVMQSVKGVAYVDVDAFGGIPEKQLNDRQRVLLTPAEIAESVQSIVQTELASRIRVNLADVEDGVIRPAQLAYLTPEVPATLILNEVRQ